MSWSEKILTGGWAVTVQSVAGTIVIAVFVVTFLAQAFTIPSESMEQTLLIGDYLLVDKFCYGDGGLLSRLLPYRKIRRGDVIVFHYPVNPAQDFVKRVVAVPGDRLRLINKRSTSMASGKRSPTCNTSPRRGILIATTFRAPTLPTMASMQNGGSRCRSWSKTIS